MGWLSSLPQHVRVVFYGEPESIPAAASDRVHEFIPTEGLRAVSWCYLHHLLRTGRQAAGWTIFTNGQPFHFNHLFGQVLELQSLWQEVQPLSFMHSRRLQLPPMDALKRSRREWLGDCPVRREPFSLDTLNTLTFHQPAFARLVAHYHQKFDTSRHRHLAHHFLELLGLGDIAAQAAEAMFGTYAHGSIFAVSADRLACLPEDSVAMALALLERDQMLFGGLCDRFWLHLFGEAFLLPVED